MGLSIMGAHSRQTRGHEFNRCGRLLPSDDIAQAQYGGFAKIGDRNIVP